MVKSHVVLREALKERREEEAHLPKAKRHTARAKSERSEQ